MTRKVSNKQIYQGLVFLNRFLMMSFVAMLFYATYFIFSARIELWVRQIFFPNKITIENGKLIDRESKQSAFAGFDGYGLIIPSIYVRAPIVRNATWLRQSEGVWHLPHTPTPDQIGNTVIVGHRFINGPDSPFYNLDQVKPGDKIALAWGRRELLYKVSEIKVVGPYDISVEKNTRDKRLTLYTCEPLLTADKRLVVVALPI